MNGEEKSITEKCCVDLQDAAAYCHKLATDRAARLAPASAIEGWQRDSAMWSKDARELLIILIWGNENE